MKLFAVIALLIVAFVGTAVKSVPFDVFPRVVDGKDATPHSWPWQVSLQKNGRHFCGGSLINKDWVLTAAHCFDKNPCSSGYTVVVGAHRLRGSTSVQKTHSISHLYKHEGFSYRHLKHDVTLLKLKKPVQFSDKVKAVSLPQAGSRIAAGTNCYITGWGRTVGGGSTADIIQELILPVAKDDHCKQVNAKLNVPIDPRYMICAGGKGIGSGCQGDSGGPFVCNENGKWILRGAVSWGHHMCRTDYYTVFARVSEYISWINASIEDEGNGARKASCGSGGAGSSGGSGGGGSSAGSGGSGSSGGGAGSGSGCKDRYFKCPSWRSYCRLDYLVFMNCKKTCNTCKN